MQAQSFRPADNGVSRMFFAHLEKLCTEMFGEIINASRNMADIHFLARLLIDLSRNWVAAYVIWLLIWQRYDCMWPYQTWNHVLSCGYEMGGLAHYLGMKQWKRWWKAILKFWKCIVFSIRCPIVCLMKMLQRVVSPTMLAHKDIKGRG